MSNEQDNQQAEWLAAFQSTAERLNSALTKLPVDKTALLLSIAEGMSLLVAREIERLSGPAPTDHPGQLRLFPEG